MIEELLLAAVSDPDANAWANAVQGAGGFVTGPQRRRVATLIRSLKAAGVWTTLDRLWLFAAENNVQALICLKSRVTATGVNAQSFTANRGFAGNGAAFYIDTGFNPTSGTPNYARNSAMFGVWIETADTVSGRYHMGNTSTGVSYIQSGVSDYVGNANGSSNDDTAVATSARGFLGFSRTAASGAGAVTSYLNGTQTATFADASAALVNSNYFVIGTNNAGTVASPSRIRASASVIGSGLTSAQMAALYAPMRTYMTAVGVA